MNHESSSGVKKESTLVVCTYLIASWVKIFDSTRIVGSFSVVSFKTSRDCHCDTPRYSFPFGTQSRLQRYVRGLSSESDVVNRREEKREDAARMDSGGFEPSSNFADFLRRCGGYAVLDGGLATELERHGANLNDPLWSAKCLLTSPHLIRRVHLDYLDAGANVIITASYQATIQGFEAKGLSKQESETLLRRSVEIAVEARDIYSERCTKSTTDVMRNGGNSVQPILVAASVGSYGAYLADGSEYSGNYGPKVSKETLKNFHRRRVQVLANAGADLIAFETIPNLLEAQAYAELLEEESIKIPAWFAFNSKDGINVVSGDSIQACAAVAESSRHVVAVGINCTPPRFIHGLITSIQRVTDKPILVYPNSGETYNAELKGWVKSTGAANEADFVSYVGEWREAGATLVGGCCRTTPNTIRAISTALYNKSINVKIPQLQ